MIILDTNILWNVPLDSVSTDLLKTIRTSGVEGVSVPWVVLEELTSHRAVAYREKYERAADALQNLKGTTPWAVGANLPPLGLERFQEHWREKFLAIVDMIPTSEAALREATLREANVLPPCKYVNAGDEQVKTGGRDAAIWLTAVEYARNHPDETVYFISRNTRDFGDGTSYPYPMDKDLAGIADRFVHLTSLGQVVKKFAKQTDDIDEDAVLSTLQAAESLSAIGELARRLMPVTWDHLRGVGGPTFEGTMGFSAEDLETHEITTVATEPVRVLGWVEAPTVTLDHGGDLNAYRIGEHVWCTATVRWTLSGPALLDGSLRVEGVGCQWKTRVLVSPTSTESPLTVLRSQATRGLSTGEFAALSPHPKLRADRVENMSKWATLRQHVTRAGMDLTRLELSLTSGLTGNPGLWDPSSVAPDGDGEE